MFSPKNLIPFPLYGSGVFNFLNCAAVSPMSCLSIHVNVTISLPFGSFSTATVIPAGIGKLTGCENPSASANPVPAAFAVKPTHKI